jgi:hypothetical protein
MADQKPKAVRGPGGKFVRNDTPPSTPAPVEAAPEAVSMLSPGSIVWAMDRVVNGATVKRAAWLGNKSIGLDHPSRNILENEDIVAQDWEEV